MRKDHLRAALKRYGNTVTVLRNGKREIARAFIQPLRKLNRLYLNDRYTPAGFFDNGYRLYIGDPRTAFGCSDGTVIVCGGDRYSVVNAEHYIVNGDVVYMWAILRRQAESKEDDYDVDD